MMSSPFMICLLGAARRQILQRGFGQGQFRWPREYSRSGPQGHWEPAGIRCFDALPGNCRRYSCHELEYVLQDNFRLSSQESTSVTKIFIYVHQC